MSGWYSPSRLSNNSTQFVEQGDRFIPTRSLMNLDTARCSLRRNTQENSNAVTNSGAILTAKEEYKRIVEENLTLDSEGKPLKILVFKGSPRSQGRRLRLLDEMMQQEKDTSNAVKPLRRLPKSPLRVLDAPNLVDDYYLNLMDWGKNNILAIALGYTLYLWNAGSGETHKFMETDGDENYLTSVAWSGDGKTLAIGSADSRLQLWDATTSHLVRNLEGHHSRVGSLSWNDHLLASASRDASIVNHDVRADSHLVSRLRGHFEEVCGLRWSGNGNLLASGGNDNLLHIWETRSMVSCKYLHRFNDHNAAIKALAWCPYQSKILASGGGTNDRCIKIWDCQIGRCLNSLDTNAQVCALEWNRHQKEILSAHGFRKNQLCLWRYPSMSKIGELPGHASRILHLSQSPDGSTVVSAGADETLRFWGVFGPPQSPSRMEDKECLSPLSLKNMHIR
ncbi:cell division cycle 20.2, cofactor of APC complex-like [Tasmannia lanceolata]|uniref:cell division cycle 20.2, cofactor of APC complex-like n=1 Tax=Tasmannia lanceolata TaxID=3420 RepID=UPI004064992E